MKLACADYSFPLLAHDRVLDLIALLEFEAVDVGLFEGRSHLQPSGEFAAVRDSAGRLARKLGDRGLRPADIFLQTAPEFVSLAPNHPEEGRRRRAREVFALALDYAAEAGSRHVTALPGVHFAAEPYAASFDRCRDELAWRCEQAAERGIVFAVEPHVGSIVDTPEAAARLAAATPGLTLALDYSHFTRAGLPDSEVEPLVRFASHFHARCARPGRLQASFQENTIDFARACRALRAAGYDGFLTVEYVWIDWEHCNEVDNLSETILLRDFLRSTIEA
jgi:sugar phosphate isomerase/epimerase